MSQFVFEFIGNCFFVLAEWMGLVKDDGKPFRLSTVVALVLIIVVVVYLLTP